SPKEDEKAALLRRCRAEWAEESLDWLDAALVILADAKLDYPGLLGTGGNDGRLEFTGTFLARLSELFDPASGNPRPQAEPLLSGALFGTTVSGLVLGRAVGQFLPGGAGGANSVAGYQGESLVNPWDFVLALEGTLILRVAAVRRLDGSGLARAAAPFAVRSQAGGYGSASAADEGARGEQWLPLWGQPASLAEVQAIFREARLQIGRRRARG